MALEKEPSSSSQTLPEPRGLLYLLLGVFSFSAWLLSKFYPPREHSTDVEQTQDNTARTCERRENRPPTPVRVVIDAFPPASTPPDEWKAAQNKKDRREWWKIGIEIATLLVVSLYTYVSCNQWKTAERQLEISERPWVALDIQFVSPFVTTNTDVRLTVQVGLRNTGHSPAGRLRTWADLLPSQPKHVGVERAKVCGAATSIGRKNPDLADTLFPESAGHDPSLPQQWVLHIDKPNIPADGFVEPTIIVCVAYGSTFDEKPIYQTAKVIYIRTTDARGNAAPINTRETPIPLQQLAVFPAYEGANYAK